jgi:hypothetical protein
MKYISKDLDTEEIQKLVMMLRFGHKYQAPGDHTYMSFQKISIVLGIPVHTLR